MSSHPIYGDHRGNLQRWENDLRSKNKRMEDGTMFPQHWFSLPGLYAMMQIGEKMEVVARLDDQAKDGFKEILDHEVTSFLTKLSKQPYIMAQELTTEATMMAALPRPLTNAIWPNEKRKRRRRILSLETKMPDEGRDSAYSFVEKVNQKLLSARRKIAKSLAKVKLEKPKKWRWQKNDPILIPKVPSPLKVDPEEPMPEHEQKIKGVDPCLEPHSPASVAACIKFAGGPNLDDPGVQQAYERAYRSALNAERMESGETPLLESEPLKPTKNSQPNGFLLKKLENSLEQIRNSRSSINETTKDLSVGVLKRLKTELIRLESNKTEIGTFSLLEIGEKEQTLSGKKAGCDKAKTRGNCEIARNMYESNQKNGIYTAPCVWCVRIEGGAEEGICIEDVHSQTLEGYQCTAFETGELGQQDDSRINTAGPYVKEPHASPSHEIKKIGKSSLAGEVIKDVIADETMMVAMDRMAEETAKGLKIAIESSVFRETNLFMTEELTNGLTESLSSSLSATVSRSMLRKNTREITSKVVSIVTHILTATLGQALTRRPQDDYYCHYCRTEKVYCTLCFQSTTGDYQKDYYSNYFAEYYSKYYSYYYGEVLSEGFAGESINQRPTPKM